MANNLNSSLNSLHAYEDDLFYFESDHLALKGNKDYCEVLKTLVVLSAQREKCIKDFNKVVEIKKRALEDPFNILEKIQKGDDLGVPLMNELPKIPMVNFNKYDIKVPEEELKLIYSESLSNKPEEDSINMKQNANNNSKVWTLEEQKRLEELLDIYPPEPVEMRRYKKIARALGNRTVQQVSSRVQKYFLKLYKAGLPIPGRIPKSCEKYKKSVIHKHQRHNHYLWKPTTFFPDLFVPVMMNELDNIPGPGLPTSSPSTSTSGSSNYLLPTEYHNSNVPMTKTRAELQLDLLKRIRLEKVKEQDGNENLFRHHGYRCDYCDLDPIIGSRWHCMTCTDSVDYCTDCVLSQMYSDCSHPLHHTLAVFHNDTENPSLPLSDPDSGDESTAAKNYDSDSNSTGEFDSNNMENFSQYETSGYDTKGDDVSEYDCNNILEGLVENGGSKDNSTMNLDSFDF